MGADIPAIYEYLALRDWKFEIDLEEGAHGDFFWLRCAELDGADLFELIDLPEGEFRVLVTHWDGTFGAETYRHESNWRIVGRVAVSQPSNEMPTLFDSADNAQMIVEHPLSDEEIASLIVEFEEPYSSLSEQSKEVERFWQVVHAVNPYCYFSYGLSDRFFTFVSRGKNLCSQLLGKAPWEELERDSKERAINRARQLWNAIGPECGPEKCIEPNCDHLRIKLAVRCFVHQVDWGGNPSS